IFFKDNGELIAKDGARYKKILDYTADEAYEIDIKLESSSRSYTLTVNGKDEMFRIFYAPVHEFERIMFRTGEQRYFPNPDTPAEIYTDLENTGKQIPEASFYIKSLKTNSF